MSADDFLVTAQDLVVNRWRRYGKDRLYVETPDGTKVGFWDLVTDTGHPESPDDEAALDAAVAEWRHEAGPTAQVPPAPMFAVEAPDTPAVAPPPGNTLETVPATSTTAADADSTDRRSVPLAAVALDEPPGFGTGPRITETAAQTPAAAPTGNLASAEPLRPWVDLATNQPGAEAREQAQAARDAAPVKTVLARVLGVHTDERAWRIGADGEERVAAQLAKAAKKDPRWRILHAIPVGVRGSDIDHLVIGPGGVFTANAKHHPGAKIWVGGNTLMVNGTKQPYVRNARHEAERAARLLTQSCGFAVHVEGLIVTVNADDVVVKAQPAGVSVIPRMQVAKWLLRHGDIHNPDTVDAIFEAARRSTTWR